ncbi:C1 1 domain containing protein [Asbolus verrucosus]|uniref:C1 1 domain containing protein n=1 Tax=Asbolus verrucosus TaxID=1661398 RepID=A0A482WB24_ASBVE|nr:C1 1 domain containing protein [Asbolus verrucosus]
MASVAGSTEQPPAAHGHSFCKKTFHKPTYCHHCSDMLWGLIQQGFICEGEPLATLLPPAAAGPRGNRSQTGPRSPPADFATETPSAAAHRHPVRR